MGLTFIFGILLFDLGLIFQLDGLFFEDGTFHILDHFLLLFP